MNKLITTTIVAVILATSVLANSRYDKIINTIYSPVSGIENIKVSALYQDASPSWRGNGQISPNWR